MRKVGINKLFAVVHHTATPTDFTAEDIDAIHREMGFAMVGYNYLITEQGCKVGRPANRRGAHTVVSRSVAPSFYLGCDMNSVSIGIALIGDFSKRAATPKMINEAAYHIRQLCLKHRIPINRKHIFGHYKVSATFCPGRKTMEAIYKKMGI